MTVGAVSSTTIYSNSLQYKYFHTVLSDAQVQDLLRNYGILPSGDADIDLDNLYNVMYAQASKDATEAAGSIASTQQTQTPQNTQSTQTTQSSTEVPWATLMSQVGLTATGDLDKDYASFNEKISLMSASATTPQDRANVAQLEAQANIVFVQPTQTAQASNSNQSNTQGAMATATATATGADIVAMLNKLYLNI